MRLQDDPRQKFAVIGFAQNAELQTACAIARQQKQRQLQAVIPRLHDGFGKQVPADLLRHCESLSGVAGTHHLIFP